MKYLQGKYFIAMLGMGLLLAGCKKDFLDVNDDPNRVTDATVTAELIFPQAAHNVGVRMASNNISFAENWMGYWAPSGDYAINQTETTYNIDFNFGNTLWQNNYDVLYDLYLTKVKAQAAGNNVLAGAAMILSARLFQDLVDIFGDLPYSQAFQNNKYTTPVYDKAQDVYAALNQSLDSAIIYMHETGTASFASADIIAHGDQTKWIKFANTLKLRLLIRQSQVQGFDPAADAAKIVSEGGVLHEGESMMVNPGYTNATSKQSPFYAFFGFTPTGAEASPATRANQYFVGILTGNSDPRLARFFAAPVAGGAIAGNTYGLAAGNPPGRNTSNFGPGLVASASQSQWIFTSFESMFLEAEAIARGWLPGDAETAYEAAVTESFVWLGVPSASSAAATYLSNANIANWANAGTTADEQAKFISFQKYISLCGIDPIEAWSDQRRLNMMPDDGYISVNPGRISNTLPVRLLYAQSEYTNNGNNTPKGIDQFTSKLFWQP